MKLVKKLLVGALSLALVVGACFTFTACNKVKGKTYAYESFTITVVYKTEEVDGKVQIKETKELSIEDYYKYLLKQGEGATLDNLSEYTLKNEEKEAMYEFPALSEILGMKEYAEMSKLEFDGNKMIQSLVDENEYTGEKSVYVTECEYSEKDGVYTAEHVTYENEEKTSYEINYITFTVNEDGKIVMPMYEMFNEETIEKGAIFAVNFIYAEVK